MERKTARRLAAGFTAAVAVAGGGAALAATQLGTPKEESAAVVADAAKQLGVAPAKLDSALRSALANRVDRAVADGKLTKEQGDALKQRLRSADTPLFGGPLRGGGRGHGPGGHPGLRVELSAAATYLGMTDAALREALRSGSTLAELAKAKGKTVDGLVDILVADAKAKLDAAVASGKLTDAQAKELAARLEERVTAVVNGELRHGPRPGFAPGKGFRGGGAFRGGQRFRGGAPSTA